MPGLDDAIAAWELGEAVGSLAFDRSGRVLAFALGDGTLALADPARADAPRRVAAHDGAILCLCADGDEPGFLTGGDDGRLVRVAADGAVAPLHAWKGKWVEHVLAPAGAPFRAAGVGKSVFVFQRAGAGDAPAELVHPSTVGGIAANPKGRRLAVAHYNGVSLWWAHGREQKPKLLAWAGSHIGVTWSPDGDYVVSMMQENALHGWRLSDGQDMRMSGYPAKVRSAAWSQHPYFLATAGAERIVCWPFSGAGPMGKPPAELGYPRDSLVAAVAVHPRGDIVAAGYADGAIAVGSVSANAAGIVKPPGGGRMAALAFSPDGARVGFATEDGLAGVIDLEAVARG
jgi:WD40 repeat protein